MHIITATVRVPQFIATTQRGSKAELSCYISPLDTFLCSCSVSAQATDCTRNGLEHLADTQINNTGSSCYLEFYSNLTSATVKQNVFCRTAVRNAYCQ